MWYFPVHSDKKKNWNTMDITDWLSFFIFPIDLARLYPVEWSSVSLGAEMPLNIVLDSLRKCQEMAVAYSVLFLTGISLVEILYMSHTFKQASSCLIVYASLIWQGISCATPWKWKSLVHSTLFLSECSILEPGRFNLKLSKLLSFAYLWQDVG